MDGERRNRRRPDQARVVVMGLGNDRHEPAEPDAIAAHPEGLLLALTSARNVPAGKPRRVSVSQLERVRHLDRLNQLKTPRRSWGTDRRPDMR